MKDAARTDTDDLQAGEKKEQGDRSAPNTSPGEHIEPPHPSAPETTAAETKSGDGGFQAHLAELNLAVAALREELASLHELCAKGFATNQWKDEAIDRMQRRLEEYERDMLRVIQEPLLRDLLLLHDSMTKLLEKSQKQVLEPKKFVKEVGFLRDELEEIFAVQNLTPVQAGVNQKYDPKYQKAVRTESAANAEEHEMVTQVVREGFIWGERMLRKQHVVVRKWEPERLPLEQKKVTMT